MTDISEFQELMRKIYLHRDMKRGPEDTMLWLVSEVGEFASALIKRDKKDLENEASDILAWLCSECNLLGIDLEQAAINKYDGKCPKCRKDVCGCARNF